MALPEAEPQPLDEAVVRLLFAISAPSDLAGRNLALIDVAKEIRRLMEALKDVLRGGRCKATILPGQTGLPPGLPDDLDKAGWDIADGKTTLDNIGRLLDDHHVFHFLGHGQYNRGHGWLLLENEDGTAQWKVDTDLAAMLGNTPVRLVFLAACESARRDTDLAAGAQLKSSFQGLAATLVQLGGIPAVVGMQEQLQIDDAYTLTGVFYRKLFLEHGEVDRALNEARAFLYSQDKKPDWGTPVLTMRLKTGQLAVANPVWTALQAIREHDDYETIRTGHYINLSLQAILVNEGQDASQYEQPELQRIGTRGLIDAVLEHLAKRSTAKDSASTAPLVLVLGGPSSGKSMQMKRLGWETVQAGRRGPAEELFLPLYMSLEDYRPSTTEALEGQILDRLRLFLPGLAARSLEKLSKDMPQVRLRILFSAGDTLPEVGRDLVRLAVTLARENPRHQYVLAIQTSALQWDDLKEIDRAQRCILAIQSLTQRGIRHVLEAQGRPGQRLLDALHGTSLFELASTPFFLVKMLGKAKKGQYPISRAETLQQLIDEAITQVPARQGMRANAPRTLFEMAWEMARSDITNWPIGEAFRAMRNLRGEREYDIEELYEALLEQDILLSVGEDTMRFSYSSIQAYCCAKAILALPERNKTLRDLVGSLGSPIQLRRWEETLVMACGLLTMKTGPDDQQTLRLLLEPIILGADLLEGTRVFLGARCLLECRSVLSVKADTKAKQELGKLVDHVVNALRWRADSANEPDLARRLQATQLLAQLAMPEIAVGLARKAYCLVRQNVAKEWDYEFSSVRFAAAIALRRMPPEQAAAALNEISPKLVALFAAWQKKDVNTLIQHTNDSEDLGIQGLAALALGDLHEPLESVELHEDAQRALNCLKEMFTSGETCQNVRWAVADALSLLDSARVIDVIVNPLLRELGSTGGTSLKNLARIRKSLAYLIGLIRLRDKRARNFLVQECLGLKGEGGSKDWRIWATAITALGRVGDRSDMKLLAEIAAGRAKGRKLEDLISQEEQRNMVRREAINALVAQGDLEVLKPKDRESLANEPALSRAYYQAIQEIYWRREAAARVAQGKIV
jgi:hypothetical protein